MENINISNSEIINLDVYSTEELLQKVKSREFSISSLIDSQKEVLLKENKEKIISIFLQLDIEEVIEAFELTSSNNRNVRQLSSFCFFEKIKFLLKKRENFEINIVKKLSKRSKDVDSEIRIKFLEMISEYIITQKQFKQEFSYFKFSINDKTDEVRKSSLRIIKKFLEHKKLLPLVFGLNERIVEMALKDKNSYVQKLASSVICDIYNKIFSKKGKEEEHTEIKISNKTILKVLNKKMCTKTLKIFAKKFNEENMIKQNMSVAEKELLVNQDSMIKDGEEIKLLEKKIIIEKLKYSPLLLHEISRNLKNEDKYDFKSISMTENEAELFFSFVKNFYKFGLTCCEENNCYLNIFKFLKTEFIFSDVLLELLAYLKSNDFLFTNFLSILSDLSESLRKSPETTCKILEFIEQTRTTNKNEKYEDEYIKLLFSLKDDFKKVVYDSINNLKKEKVIKLFDISDKLDGDDSFTVKMYSILWKLTGGDFDFYKKVNLDSFKDSEISNFVDFYIFFTNNLKKIKKNQDLNVNDEQSIEKTAITEIKQRLTSMCVSKIDIIISDIAIYKKFLKLIEADDFDSNFCYKIFNSRFYDRIFELRNKQKIFDIFFQYIDFEFETENSTKNSEFIAQNLLKNFKNRKINVFQLFNKKIKEEKMLKILEILSHFLKIEEVVALEGKASGDLKIVLKKRLNQQIF